MAEVRQRFGAVAAKLVKSSHLILFVAGSKHATTIVPVVFTLPQLIMKTENDVVSVRGSRSRLSIQTDPNCFQRSVKTDTSGEGGILNVSVLARMKSDYIPRNILESVTLCNGVSMLLTETHTLHRAHVVTRINSSVSRTEMRPPIEANLSGHGSKREPLRSVPTRSLYGVSRSGVRQFIFDRRLIRAYSGSSRNGSQDTQMYKSKTEYYDILEVPPTSTQAQIKTAYYKQSFIYHPDKNAGSEGATFRFSQICEAYNVLGNKTLRKKYDRGILSQADLQGSSRTSSAKESPSKSSGQHTRTRHSPTLGADPHNVFDFDAFFRAHYGEQLQREKDLRAQREQILKKKQKNYRDWELGRMAEIAVGMMVAMAAVLLLSLRSN